MHSDVSRYTYVDFATNSGRYAVGTTNALLDHIRLRDEGVRIEYTETSGKSEPYTMEHGMLSFESVSDIGSSTAISYNYVVTAAHQTNVPYPTFTANEWGIGTNRSIKYMGIEEGSEGNKFIHQIFGGSYPGTEQDYKISRLSKLITDVDPAAVYSGDISNELKSPTTTTLVYRVGGGTQVTWDKDGNAKEANEAGVYTVGGIGYISDVVKVSDDFTRVLVTTAEKTASGGASDLTPLPFGSQSGDSGSPYFVWDAPSQSFKFLMEHIGTIGATLKRGGSAAGWTQYQMNADNVYVNMGTVKGRLRIEGAEAPKDGGTTDIIKDQEVTVNPAVGYLRDDGGNLNKDNGESVTIRAVETGQHTWKDLSGLKNNDDWYGYDSRYLNATKSVTIDKDKNPVIAEGITYAKLYMTQNLVLLAASNEASYNVKVTQNTDLGVGYMHFAANGYKDVVFSVVSDYDVELGNEKQLDSAGYIVDAGVQVNVSMRNADTAYMREWRKVGEGTLNICGTGNNEIFLNVGGKGETLLNQNGATKDETAYAAYNVLVNTGSTVRIANTGQIYRDLTFGNGGGTLDMNGQSMDWYLTGGEDKDGFTIHALTEEAVISNSAKEHSSLVFCETGSQKFVGSFSDSDGQSSLGITYAGGGTWELNGIRTSLTNAESGLTVQNGTVKLAGTLTVHGYGSSSYSMTEVDFSTRENDWHYADATMNVTVKDKAVFELESHARLIGTVTVESGGKYIMHEGVQNAQEYIEGGEKLEDTDDIRAYYGHKGDVKLEEGATLFWQRGSKDVANLVGTADSGALTGVEATIRAENWLQLAASDKEVQGRIAGAKLSLHGGGTLDMENVYLETGSMIESGGHTSINMKGVTLQLEQLDSASSVTSPLGEELALTAYKAGESLTLRSGLNVLELEVDSLSVVTDGSMLVTGQALTLDMSMLELIGVHAIKVHFADGVSINENMAVTALTAEDTLGGYYATNDAGSVYFVLSVPEPATATLSLLALAGLMARRRRV